MLFIFLIRSITLDVLADDTGEGLVGGVGGEGEHTDHLVKLRLVAVIDVVPDHGQLTTHLPRRPAKSEYIHGLMIISCK